MSDDLRMGVLFDYFVAPSDERAAETLDIVVALLTGIDDDTVAANPRSGHAVAIRDEGEGLVLTITDELQHALASASPPQLAAVAVPWSQTEEFRGDANPEALAPFLGELAQLARIATESGSRLYCWVCV